MDLRSQQVRATELVMGSTLPSVKHKPNFLQAVVVLGTRRVPVVGTC